MLPGNEVEVLNASNRQLAPSHLRPFALKVFCVAPAYTSARGSVASPNVGGRTFILSIIER